MLDNEWAATASAPKGGLPYARSIGQRCTSGYARPNSLYLRWPLRVSHVWFRPRDISLWGTGEEAEKGRQKHLHSSFCFFACVQPAWAMQMQRKANQKQSRGQAGVAAAACRGMTTGKRRKNKARKTRLEKAKRNACGMGDIICRCWWWSQVHSDFAACAP